MTTRVGQFGEQILPYFFNTSGKVCAERLSSMIVMILAWAGTLLYAFTDEAWQGMPGIILPLVIGGFLPEVRFVIQQAGKRPVWGGLDPLGWATDYNGHPSTHRVKMIVSVFLACLVIVTGSLVSESASSSGEKLVALCLLIVPLAFAFVFEVIERRGTVKESSEVCEETDFHG